MKPTGIEKKAKYIAILYVCEKCGHKYRVKKAEADNMEKILELISDSALQ